MTSEPGALDRIRATETEIVRKIAVAREQAKQAATDAQKRVDDLKQQAQEAGQHAGEVEAEAIIANARIEADNMLESARQQAEVLRANVDDERLAAVVNDMVALIVGRNRET